MGARISYVLLAAACGVIILLMYRNMELSAETDYLQQRLVTPKVGSWIPEIVVRDIDNGVAFIGGSSNVIRVIYVMDPDCPVCEASLPGVKAIEDGLGKNSGNSLLVLSTRDAGTLRMYREQNDLKSSRFVHSDVEIHERLGVRVVPTTLVITADGRVSAAHVGVLDEKAVNQILVATRDERRHRAITMPSKEKS